MPWTYKQATGELANPAGDVVEVGYAGAQPYVNQPLAEWRENLGPLPTGLYRLGDAYDHPNLGPCAIPLGPHPDNQMYGRDDFFVHGDTESMDQTASQGCIIMSRATRDQLVASDIRVLEVIV